MNPRFIVTLIMLIFFALIGAGFILFFRYQTTASCDQFEDGIVRDLPVRCLEYFNQK